MVTITVTMIVCAYFSRKWFNINIILCLRLLSMVCSINMLPQRSHLMQGWPWCRNSKSKPLLDKISQFQHTFIAQNSSNLGSKQKMYTFLLQKKSFGSDFPWAKIWLIWLYIHLCWTSVSSTLKHDENNILTAIIRNHTRVKVPPMVSHCTWWDALWWNGSLF